MSNVIKRRMRRAARRHLRSGGPVDWFTATFVLVLVIGGILMTPANWPECPTEDSTNCHWDATQHGNGKGTSFTTVEIFGHVITF